MTTTRTKTTTKTIQDRITAILTVCTIYTDVDTKAQAYRLIKTGKEILSARQRLAKDMYTDELQREYDEFFSDEITCRDFLADSQDFINRRS